VGVFDVRRPLARAIFLHSSPPRARRVRPFRTIASRCCSAHSRALSVDDSPPPFCVDENPRLTACTVRDCLPVLQTRIASIVRALLLSSIFAYDLVGFPSSSLVSSRAEYTRAYLPQSSPCFPIPLRSQCTVLYLRPVSASAYARIIGMHLIFLHLCFIR
jgi:hypothetical protein